MDYRERITSDYKIMLGKPIIKGTRITVEHILNKLAEGATKDDIIKMYPQLSKDDISVALNYASQVIGNEDVIDISK